ncbi:MAG: ATP-binding protein [Patescibacteria group bacterium]|jgi:predicted kinase
MIKTLTCFWAVAISYFPPVRTKLCQTAKDIIAEYGTPRLHRKFIMAVGHSKAGKRTVLAREEGLHIDTDDIHRRINQMFALLQRDDLVGTRAYWTRQIFTWAVRSMILNDVLQKGVRVVSDSCNLRASERRKVLRLAKIYHYRTVIIYVTCPECVLLERLEEADDLRVTHGEPPVWVTIYQTVQKPRLDPPTADEADEFFVIPTA